MVKSFRQSLNLLKVGIELLAFLDDPANFISLKIGVEPRDFLGLLFFIGAALLNFLAALKAFLWDNFLELSLKFPYFSETIFLDFSILAIKRSLAEASP